MTSTTTDKPQGVAMISISILRPSPTNPRKHFDEAKLAELAESMKKHGVLQPIVARGVGSHYEIVAGERRFRAAKIAGLTEVPVSIREMSDEDALEVQAIENLQRQDLHALEEAEGYKQLLGIRGYDVAKIAARVGRSVKYIYDRVKLLTLIEPLKKALREDRITPGHAILLARLSTMDQQRVSDKNRGGLWHGEDVHFDFGEGKTDGLKPCSVRELQQYIDEHVRFVPSRDADPMLFPETAMTLKAATDQKADKIVAITHSAHVQDSARNGEKIIMPKSWERADGKKGSKTCEFSAIGVIVTGQGRGESFRVCANKEKCKTHWGSWQKAREKRQKMAASGDSAGVSMSLKAQREKEEREQKEQEAAIARWNKAMPEIQKAVVDAIQRASTKSDGVLAKLLIGSIEDQRWKPLNKNIKAMLTIGTSADDVLRYAAFLMLMWQLEDKDADDFSDVAKSLGIDLKKLLAQAAPVQTSAESKPAAKPKK